MPLHASSPDASSALVSPHSGRPLLKWAGGKRQLLPVIREHYPQTFTRFVEPFFGSGAVFFDLHAAGLLGGRDARLADANPDLVGCYTMVRDHQAEVVTHLRRLAASYARQGDTFYYEVRDRRFNPQRAALRADGVDNRTVAARYTPALAAMLIFLNRTGFNGLFRLNRDGAFNVPAGRYADPRICDVDHLAGVAAAFGAPGVSLECTPFDDVIASAGEGDFVYCDPPYAPLSKTASFAHYTAGGFSAFDQRRLQQAVIEACRRGARVVLSNSSAPEIVTLYASAAARRAGLTVALVPARRAINSRAASRGAVDEVLVSNVKPLKLRMAKAGLTPRRSRSGGSMTGTRRPA